MLKLIAQKPRADITSHRARTKRARAFWLTDLRGDRGARLRRRFFLLLCAGRRRYFGRENCVCSGEYVSKGLQTVGYRKCMTATLTEQTRGIYQLRWLALTTMYYIVPYGYTNRGSTQTKIPVTKTGIKCSYKPPQSQTIRTTIPARTTVPARSKRPTFISQRR